jgi:hypothetical protein
MKEERGDGKHYLFLSADSQEMQEAYIFRRLKAERPFR